MGFEFHFDQHEKMTPAQRVEDSELVFIKANRKAADRVVEESRTYCMKLELAAMKKRGEDAIPIGKTKAIPVRGASKDSPKMGE